MTNTQILAKDKDDVGPFVSTDVLVKLKGYAFTFRREPAGYTPDPDFVPFIWRRKGDDAEDGSGAKEKDDEMDTSEYNGNPSINSSSSSAPATHIQVPQVQRRELASPGLGGAPGGGPMIVAVTPFNSSPQTPRGMELAAHLRANSTLGGCLEQSTPRVDFASQPSSPTHTAASHPAVLKSGPATGGSAGRLDSSSKHKQPAGRVVLQPSLQTLTTATQPAVSMTVQGSDDGPIAHVQRF